jgi:lysyl-tRNA synthetase class 2
MKKLIAAGETRIFAFAPVYRNAERSALHSPEFTMLEWYEAGAGYTHIMDQCEDMLRIAATTIGADVFDRQGRRIDPLAPAARMTVAEAFAHHAGIDLLATLTKTGCDRDALARAAMGIGVRVADDDTWSDLFSRIMVERIEPAIGNGRATILTEFPAVEAALARRCAHDPRVSERFEMYACGVELANCFGELTEPVELRRRFELEMDEKERLYGERYPIDEDFLAALAVMPQTSGGALGFDRLVMLATGASRIDQVLWTPIA